MEQVRFLSPRQVEALTSLSARHLARLAEAGRFPKPARLGEGKNGRLGFVEAEVLAWNAARMEERNADTKPIQTVESGTVESIAAAPQTSPRPKSSVRQRERPTASAKDAR